MGTSDDVVDELREALAPELLLLEPIGSGGMGDVYLARDPVLKRNVAVKLLAPRLGLSPSARLRFAREAEAAAAVAHPNVVPIHRVGHLPRSELGYIVMAYVEGPSLRDLVPEGTVASESDVRRVVGEVAAALAAAHARGVVHRDIKPANVLYDPPGGRFVVVDFGIAAVANRDTDGAGARLTMEGVPVGTPSYMSPEQAAGDPVDEKSDIYSLGCVAYELLAGRPPITGATAAAVVRGHLATSPPPLASLRSDLSPDFAALVMRCLEKDPARRPDAEELTRALGVVQRATVEWPPPGLESLHRQGALWTRTVGRFATALLAFVLILGIHPAAARPCCADFPDRSPGWLLLKRLSMVTPIHFDDPDALAIWYFLLDVSFFVMLAAMIPMAVRTTQLARWLLAGRRSGYPVAVLAGVAWDRHRDTAQLLNLTGRYALLPAGRQERQLRRRAVAAAAVTLAFIVLIAGSLSWLGGGLEIRSAPGSGLLPFSELVLVAGPAAAGLVVYLVLEAVDLGQRRAPRRQGRKRQPLRADVLRGWLTAAGVGPPAERWSGVGIRILAGAGIAAGLLAVVVAAYALIAVFGASARFAGDRAGAREWVRERLDPRASDSIPPPLSPRTALALTAAIPLEPELTRILLGGQLPFPERRLVVASIAPAFCMNPREVLFGVAPARLEERDRVAALLGVETAALDGGFDARSLAAGGLAGLRRRARYCERYFGEQASISPQPRPRE